MVSGRRRGVQGSGRVGRKRFHPLNFELTWQEVVRKQGVDAEPAEEVLMAWAIVEMMTSGNRNARIAAFRNLTGLRDQLALDRLHHGDSELPSLAIWTSDFVPLFHLVIVTGSLSWLFDPFKPRDAQGDADGARGVEPAHHRYPPEAQETPVKELALREFAGSAQKALFYQWSQGDARGSDPEALEAAISGCFLVHWCTIPQVRLDHPLVGLGGTLDLAMSLLKSAETSPRAVALTLCGLRTMVGNGAEEGTSVDEQLTATNAMLRDLTTKYQQDRRTFEGETAVQGLWEAYCALLRIPRGPAVVDYFVDILVALTRLDQTHRFATPQEVKQDAKRSLRDKIESRMDMRDKRDEASWVLSLDNNLPNEDPVDPRLTGSRSSLLEMIRELGVAVAEGQTGANPPTNTPADIPTALDLAAQGLQAASSSRARPQHQSLPPLETASSSPVLPEVVVDPGVVEDAVTSGRASQLPQAVVQA
ncbi:hypothetical protein FRC04_009036 [Tulasnella sp. 424]|nr:hypothetical protein FRC04_009036 [Tulasnella sp. 424]